MNDQLPINYHMSGVQVNMLVIYAKFVFALKFQCFLCFLLLLGERDTVQFVCYVAGIH